MSDHQVSVEKEKEIGWKKSCLRIFWSEVASCDRIVQIYDNENIFLNSLEGFAGDGLIKQESILVVATSGHLFRLRNRLILQGFDIDSLTANNQYIPLNIEDCLSEFMVNDWPDEALFSQFVTQHMLRAQKHTGKARMFSEIGGALHARGKTTAALQLEHLWYPLHQKEPFCLFCTYPRTGLTQEDEASISNICQIYSKVIDGSIRPSTEIYYRSTLA